jgi:GAF domain-containing protein
MQILAASLKEKVRQRTLELQVLHELNAKVQLAIGGEEIWSACLEYLGRLIPGETIAILTQPDDRIYLQHLQPLTAGVTGKIKARLQEASVEWLRGNRDWVNNIELPPIAQFKSVLMAPVNPDESEEFLGVFFIGAEPKSAFNFEQLCLLHTVAQICAQASIELAEKQNIVCGGN